MGGASRSRWRWCSAAAPVTALLLGSRQRSDRPGCWRWRRMVVVVGGATRGCRLMVVTLIEGLPVGPCPKEPRVCSKPESTAGPRSICRERERGKA